MRVLEIASFDLLLDALKVRGYDLIGPTVREGVIVYDAVFSANDFPVGWTDVQEAGRYRIERTADNALFEYNVGPDSWKKIFFPPKTLLWRADGDASRFQVLPSDETFRKTALIGVRACELHAIQIQDAVFMKGAYVDPGYRSRRENAFIVAVNCGKAGAACFCASMNTGPKASAGFDMSMTEVILDQRHFFVLESGSEAGTEVLQELECSEASPAEVAAADAIVARTSESMGRKLEMDDIAEVLARNPNHAEWEQVGKRCLACANCTMVCPTCFCSTVQDVTSLTNSRVERWRLWDSCFTGDFSYIHGGSIRKATYARYRQWMTHKLSSWKEQFGTLGCVGCGRCIAWCPVGIDITEEARRIRETDLMAATERKNCYVEA